MQSGCRRPVGWFVHVKKTLLKYELGDIHNYLEKPVKTKKKRKEKIKRALEWAHKGKIRK